MRAAGISPVLGSERKCPPVRGTPRLPAVTETEAVDGDDHGKEECKESDDDYHDDNDDDCCTDRLTTWEGEVEVEGVGGRGR